MLGINFNFNNGTTSFFDKEQGSITVKENDLDELYNLLEEIIEKIDCYKQSRNHKSIEKMSRSD